jgi:hypothetical protein
MFLLDKKAILRDVDARDGTDAKIAELLAEFRASWRTQTPGRNSIDRT